MKTYLQSTALTDRKKKKIQKQVEKSLRELQRNSDNYKFHIELGDSYCLLEDFQQAENHYISAIELLRHVPFVEKARKQIIMLYGKILSFAPDKQDIYLKLGEEYVAAGQKEKATRFLLSSAKKAFENGDYELALECYNRVIEMGKSNPYIIERSTELYLKLGRKQEAISNYIHIGELYAQEEKNVEALGYYKKAHALEPEDPEIIRKVANTYYTMEWTENAAAEFVKMAGIYEKRQFHGEALKYYQHSLELDPENEKAKTGKARVEELQVIETPWEGTEIFEVSEGQDVLQELDYVERTLEKTSIFALSENDSAFETPIIDLTERLAEKASKEVPPEVGDMQKAQAAASAIPVEECLVDLTGEDLIIEEGLELQGNVSPEILSTSEKLDPSEEERVLQGEMSSQEDVVQEILPTTEPTELAEEKLILPVEMDSQKDMASKLETIFGQMDPSEEEFILEAEVDYQEEGGQETAPASESSESSADTQHDESDEVKVLYDDYEILQMDSSIYEVPTRDEAVTLPATIQFIPEESLDEFFEDDEKEEVEEVEFQVGEEHSPPDNEVNIPEKVQTQAEEPLTIVSVEPNMKEDVETQGEEFLAIEQLQKEGNPQEGSGGQRKEPLIGDQLHEKIAELEKHLQNTQEEKYFLQEQFTTQIEQLKVKEHSISGELETISREKMELEQRLKQITALHQAKRENIAKSNDDRYNAIIEKIQKKKHLIQDHLTSLLKQREENRRVLTEDLKNLGTTKQRLQQNLEHIRKVKTRIEEKINLELQQARQEIQSLTERSKELDLKLQDQQQIEHELREEFDILNREKITIEEQSTETITALTGENTTLENQLQKTLEEKSTSEEIFKKKFRAFQLSYQRLKGGYKKSLQSKEQELNETAQNLNKFAERYVKLEHTLADIRTERDKLDEMLAQETATRETLEEKLSDIETQVDSLEIQGTELLEQFGQELDRQFSVDRSISDEFQMSLEEVEKLLALQAQEIQSLEAI